MNLYDILEISKNSTEKEIKNAYKKAAMKYHPDKQINPNKESEEMFIKIVDAYSVLINEKTRSDYDKSLELIELEIKNKEEMSDNRKKLIEDLEEKEKNINNTDPLKIFKEDLLNALENEKKKIKSFNFEDFENLILSTLSK